MKKLFLSICVLGALGLNAQAQDAKVAPAAKKEAAAAVDKNAPKFKFEEETHDFGTLKEGPQAEYFFKFKNTGKQPLIISEASASCGCTTPEWPKEPILPGKEGKIKVVYNTSGRPGPFTKSVFIKSNAAHDKDRYELFIKGNVVAAEKPAATPATGHEGHNH